MATPLPKIPRKPSVPRSTTCEVPTVNGWNVISVDEALQRNAVATRCVECKQPVRAHSPGTNGMAAHFEHLSGHPT